MPVFLCPRLQPWVAGLVLSSAAAIALAGDGHDHGDEAPAAAGTASPRVSAHSDLFELVGIVDKGQMTVYLDRYASNEPVTGARIEYEAGSAKGIAQPQADGTYTLKFDDLAKPGQLPFSITVSAGPDTDLLAGELDVHAPHDEHPVEGRPWLLRTGYAAAALAAIALALVGGRKLARTRSARVKV